MKFEGIIFDLDGTMANTLEDLSDSMNRVLAEKCFPTHSYELYKTIIGKGLRNLVTSSLPEINRTNETIDECYNLMMEDYSNNCLNKTHLYKGIAEVIEKLKQQGIKLAVLSNKIDDLTQRIVDHLADAKNFDVILGAQPDVPPKPDPKGALLIAKRMGIAPENILYIGDTGIDMLTANKAGMKAIGAAWGFRTKKELHDNGAMVILNLPVELLRITSK
ncbi:MAG: HAD family hydrolase [Bacteroidota bacterium]|nr:HAD family hydrolase [Bacteroidota bacterium]